MKTYLLYGPKDIRLADRPVPTLEAGEVLVEIKFTGICGSDLHYFNHGFCGRFVPKRPFALGHEFSGIVREVGSNVQGLSTGDEIAVDPSMPCGSCNHCRSGHYNLCFNMKFLGLPVVIHTLMDPWGSMLLYPHPTVMYCPREFI